MRFHSDRPVRRRSNIAAPFAVGALALLASACGTTPAATNSGTTATTIASVSGSPRSLLTAGLVAQKAGNFSVAIADYKSVITSAPASSTASYANYDLGDI